MTPSSQQWQTGNSSIAFPFRNGGTLPSSFIVDLRLFLSGTDVIDAFLSSVQYDATADSYTLSFAAISDNAVLLSGTVSRLPASGGSRQGQKQVIASGPRVCLFTPGAAWDDPSWGGGSDWTVAVPVHDGALLTDLVNPGPSTFKGIFIDGNVPDESLWGNGATQTLKAGWSISFGEKGRRAPALNDDVVDINAIGGEGEGYAPAPSRIIDYLTNIHGATPDARGNLQIQGADCLRVFQPRLGTALIPATVQINSDCGPCCSCSSYQNFSRAIGRRSAKFKDLCNEVNRLLSNSTKAYNDAVGIINQNRRPMAVVRNVRALGSRLQFSVQNMSSVKIFAYIQLRIPVKGYDVGSPEPLEASMVQVDTAPYAGDPAAAVDAHRSTLEALPFNVAERPTATLPTANFDPTPTPSVLVCAGQLSSSGTMIPIEPGAVVQQTLFFPHCADAMAISGGTIGSLAAAYPEFLFQTIAVYGSSHCFACSAESYRAKVVAQEDVIDELESCELPVANYFNTVHVPT